MIRIILFLKVFILLQSKKVISNLLLDDSIKSNCTGSISQMEYEGLYSLYNSTNGKHWRISKDPMNKPWVFPSNLLKPCLDWFGITCEISTISNESCIITKLKLHSVNMTGSIPSDINKLNHLITIKLDYNNLTSTIPESFYSITTLSNIVLNANSITGSISSNIGNLLELIYFYVPLNKISNSLPMEIFSLSKLQRLSVYNNLITGNLQNVSLQGTLIKIDVGSNKLNGTIGSTLFDTDNEIKVILFSNNYFSGSLPSLINAPNLLIFSISSNYLTGVIPTDMYFPKLITLELFNNLLTGTIPSQIYTFEHLDSIELYGNKINGTISNEIKKLTKLSVMNFNSNSLSGIIPFEITSLKLLVQLDLCKLLICFLLLF
jgi:hypothetical protein